MFRGIVQITPWPGLDQARIEFRIACVEAPRANTRTDGGLQGANLPCQSGVTKGLF